MSKRVSQRERQVRAAADLAIVRISQLLSDALGNPPASWQLDFIKIQMAIFGRECAPIGGIAMSACNAIALDATVALETAVAKARANAEALT
jgi:hypothetical protein